MFLKETARLKERLNTHTPFDAQLLNQQDARN